MFNHEFLEIYKFVLQTANFLKVSRVKVLEWRRQIATRICNEGAGLEQGPVP